MFYMPEPSTNRVRDIKVAAKASIVIDNLADELGLPPWILKDALKDFVGEDISEYSKDEQSTVSDVVRRNLGRLIDQRGGVKGFVGGIKPDDMFPALSRSRDELLSNPLLSSRAKEFLRDHCNCS